MLAIVVDSESRDKLVLVAVWDVDGNERQVLLPARSVASGTAGISFLVDAGLVIMPDFGKLVAGFIHLSRPQGRLERTELTGWLKDSPVFVYPGEIIGQQTGVEILHEPKSKALTQAFYSRGTLEEWRQHVAVLAKGNPLMAFVLCASLSGPLLKVVGFTGGGSHLYGRSSRGKTTMAQFAASVHGDATDPGVPTSRSLVRTWHTTANALDALAEAHSDTLLVLDEAGSFAGKDLDQTIYQLCGGQEKSTMLSSRKLRRSGNWRSNLLSTGEISIQQRIEASGRLAMAGQLVRLIDIPIGEIFTDTKGMEPGQFATELKNVCRKYFGTAGKAFVRSLQKVLAEDPEALADSLRDYVEEYAQDLAVDDVAPEQMRILRRFALYQVAGELAVQWGILPLTDADVVQAVQHARDLLYW
ncbi:MAG: DUF927 domain-containing protein [Deltaproteobacteria bacterium]|nr:DUF927 domain-containing protein [Deltaproteobacteria bacterium]